MVAVTGTHFDPGLSVTLANPHYVFTFSGVSLEKMTATSLSFDAGALVEGTYDLTVRNPSGRRSNAMPVIVSRKK